MFLVLDDSSDTRYLCADAPKFVVFIYLRISMPVIHDVPKKNPPMSEVEVTDTGGSSDAI